ncbi:SPFH domain-containing protein [Streptomyces sp. ISL-99]|uniref:SPFH domain-containing protein n=1 Tax=Streptomyces sp. ISL-99 TaxID=2819193 RepID=UPI0020358A6D|nr:SPFH domain-containing protein [Streptomyces sp. ISL-99]
MNSGLIGIVLGAAVLLLLLMAAVKIVPEYARGVIFRLGRITGAKGPGLFFIIPVVDRMFRVSLRTITMDIPPPDVIKGTSQMAQTTLRSVLGQVDLDEPLIRCPWRCCASSTCSGNPTPHRAPSAPHRHEPPASGLCAPRRSPVR